MLRLRLGPEGALEIAEEGPPLGSRDGADRALRARPGGEVGARRVRRRELPRLPRARALDRGRSPSDPLVAVESFEEEREAGASGTSCGFPAARSRSPSTATAPCSPRGPSTTSPSSRACWPPRSGAAPSARSAGRSVSERGDPRRAGRVSRAVESLAGDTSRRGFLARVGGAITALAAGGLVARAVKPGEADAFHFCGHIYTTGSCLHPTGTPADRRARLSAAGLRRPAGRQPRPSGEPQGGAGQRRRQGAAAIPTGARCPRRRGPRSATRPAACTGSRPTSTAAGIAAARATCASWSTAAPTPRRRINGDAALEGYCYRGRKVFCVMYFQTQVPC